MMILPVNPPAARKLAHHGSGRASVSAAARWAAAEVMHDYNEPRRWEMRHTQQHTDEAVCHDSKMS